MSTARELITEFFDCLEHLDTSLDRCVKLFADDGIFEFPYFQTLGIDWQFQGHAAIRAVLEVIAKSFSPFTLSDIAIHELANGKGLFVEYHSACFVRGTEKTYAQDYVTRLEVENGKIKLLREYLNIIRTARVLLPNGLQDIPAMEKDD